MIKNMSRGAIIALVVALVALVAGGAYLLWPPRGGHKVVAYFTNAVGLYAGDDVEFHQSSSKATTVGGLDAWELRYQVRIDYRANIPGDNVELLVVQHTDGSRSVLMTFATIGDAETQKQVDGARAGLRVEKR